MATSSTSFQVLGIGNVFLDQVAFVDKSFLEKHGLEEGSTNITTEMSKLDSSWNAVDSKQKSQKVTAGGSCANTIKVIQGMGNLCALRGKCGDDQTGKDLVKYFESRGVISLLTSGNKPNGVVNCFVTQNERTMQTFLGSSMDFSEEDVREEDYKNIKLCVNEGYEILFGKALQKSIDFARKYSVVSSLDLASKNIVEDFKPQFEECMYKVNYLFGNLSEMKALTNAPSPEEICEKFEDYQTIVITDGDKGCWVKAIDDKAKHYDAQFVQKVIDPTGAGDFFCGGFLDGVLKGQSITQSVKKGNLFASSVIQVVGTEFPNEQWSNIIELGKKI